MGSNKNDQKQFWRDSDNLNWKKKKKMEFRETCTKSVEVKYQERKAKQTNLTDTVKMSRDKTAWNLDRASRFYGSQVESVSLG